MLQITNSLATSKLIPTVEDSAKEVSSNNMINEVSIVDKVNTGVLESVTEFFISGARLIFAK